MKRVTPGPGQESVWDYPRPPLIERAGVRVRVEFHGAVLADTAQAVVVKETSHPPVYYVPPVDVAMPYLREASKSSYCEWKGRASYYDVEVDDRRVANAAWYYRDPVPAFVLLKDCIAFYPSKMDACYVDGERVQAQAGDFYGGWITSRVVGPFKGGAGTMGW